MTELLGRYEILEEIGQGGFAIVYRGRDTALDRLVALKELRPMLLQDSTWVKRFHYEAKTIARLDHPRIVPIYDIYEVSNRLFIVMRLIDGVSLDDLIATRGPFTWAETVDIIKAVAEGLNYAHAQGILHRDLKPANILIDAERGPMLSDFGLAKLTSESSISTSGAIVGTPHYIPPEVWEGQPNTTQSDIYALGCILYEVLTGQKIFRGNTSPAVMMAHFKPLVLPQTWPEGVPSGIAAVLQTALSNKATSRYATANQLAADLDKLARGQPLVPFFPLSRAAMKERDSKREIPTEIGLPSKSVASAMPISSSSQIRKGQIPDPDSTVVIPSETRPMMTISLEKFTKQPPLNQQQQSEAPNLAVSTQEQILQWLQTAERMLMAGNLEGAAKVAHQGQEWTQQFGTIIKNVETMARQWQEATPNDPDFLAMQKKLSNLKQLWQSKQSAEPAWPHADTQPMGASKIGTPIPQPTQFAPFTPFTPIEVCSSEKKPPEHHTKLWTSVVMGITVIALTFIVVSGVCNAFNRIVDNVLTVEVGSKATEDIRIPLPQNSAKTNLILEMNSGNLTILSGAKNDLVEGTAMYNVAGLKPKITNKANHIYLQHQNGTGLDKLSRNEIINQWNLKLRNVPFNLTVNTDIAQNNLELGGLSLTNLKISQDIGNLDLSFGEPNHTPMSIFDLKVGEVTTRLTGLANGNVENMLFKGKGGDYTLDFGGKLSGCLYANISSDALSSLTIIVPATTPAEISFDSPTDKIDAKGAWQKVDEQYILAGSGYSITMKINLEGMLKLRN